MRKPLPMHLARRCLARTRRGTPCQGPVVRERKRCRMHGGADGSGAPHGPRNGNYRTGFWTKEAIAERRFARELLREAQATLNQVDEILALLPPPGLRSEGDPGGHPGPFQRR